MALPFPFASGLLRRLASRDGRSSVAGELLRARVVQGHVEVSAEAPGASLAKADTTDEGVLANSFATEIADVLLPDNDAHPDPPIPFVPQQDLVAMSGHRPCGAKCTSHSRRGDDSLIPGDENRAARLWALSQLDAAPAMLRNNDDTGGPAYELTTRVSVSPAGSARMALFPGREPEGLRMDESCTPVDPVSQPG
jgi:hypothetical protein